MAAISLRNVDYISADYTALHPRRQNYSFFIFFTKHYEIKSNEIGGHRRYENKYKTSRVGPIETRTTEKVYMMT